MWKSTIKPDVNQRWDCVKNDGTTMQSDLFINKRELYLLTRYRNKCVMEKKKGEAKEEMIRAAGFCRTQLGALVYESFLLNDLLFSEMIRYVVTELKDMRMKERDLGRGKVNTGTKALC